MSSDTATAHKEPRMTAINRKVDFSSTSPMISLVSN